MNGTLYFAIADQVPHAKASSLAEIGVEERSISCIFTTI